MAIEEVIKNNQNLIKRVTFEFYNEWHLLQSE